MFPAESAPLTVATMAPLGSRMVSEKLSRPLVINMKAAKALGLTIPPAILARADQVIQ